MLLLRIAVQDAMRCVFYVFPEIRIRVLCGWHEALLQRDLNGFTMRTRKLYEFLQVGTKNVHVELYVTNGDQESKTKNVRYPTPYLRQQLKGFGRKKMSCFCACVLCSLCAAFLSLAP